MKKGGLGYLLRFATVPPDDVFETDYLIAMKMLSPILQQLQKAKNDPELSPLVFKQGQSLFVSGACQSLLSAQHHYE